MNIDERIKKELESESQQLDKILAEEPGLFGQVAGIFITNFFFLVNTISLSVIISQYLLQIHIETLYYSKDFAFYC